VPTTPRLWGHFEQAWESLPDLSPAFHDPDAFALAWLSLLRAYAWCVPAAAYLDEPDVSLADHLQVTGALAACLWDLPEDALGRLEADSSQDEPVALLVGGDVSGIQRFLYTISSAGAAKSLRGRSAYLGLLCDVVAEFTRRELGVLPCNVVYSGGGHFYLLAPLGVGERLAGVRERLTGVLLDFFGGDVALVLDAVPLKASDLRVAPGEPRSPLGERWRELGAKLRSAKQTLLRQVALSSLQKVFGPFGVGGREEFCVVCHSEPDQPEGLRDRGVRRPVAPAAEEAERKCSLCKSFEDLSHRVARAAYLVLRQVRPKPGGNLEWHSVLTALGLELWLDTEDELVSHYRPDDWVIRLNDPRLDPVARDGRTVPVVGFRLLPNFTPIEEDGTIREMAELAQGSDGAPYFSALRMDVDSLGRLFSEGLGGRLSLSRLATFSRSLSTFFEGYLNRICEELDPGRKHLYLLYSGGDDLLAVGSWNAVLGLAQRIRDEFGRYACNNPAVTLSGGTSLHHEKFPLYQASRLAGDLQDAAKAWHRDGRAKDAFNLWGQPLEWDELDWARDWHDRITGWLMRDGVRRAFVFKLARIASMHDRVQKELSRRRGLTEAGSPPPRPARSGGCGPSCTTWPRRARSCSRSCSASSTNSSTKTGSAVLATLARWVELSSDETKHAGEVMKVPPRPHATRPQGSGDSRNDVQRSSAGEDYECSSDVAAEWGRELARGRNLRMAQIRRVFGEVKRSQMRWEPSAPRGCSRRGSPTWRPAPGEAGRLLRDILSPAIDAVFQAQARGQQKRFRILADLFEALLAHYTEWNVGRGGEKNEQDRASSRQGARPQEMLGLTGIRIGAASPGWTSAGSTTRCCAIPSPSSRTSPDPR
jgi:CRISPR-associated protein Csm1